MPINAARNAIGGIAGRAFSGASNLVQNARKTLLNQAINSVQPVGAEAQFSSGERDWRVRLSLPQNFPAFDPPPSPRPPTLGPDDGLRGPTPVAEPQLDILAPLRETNNSMVFPYTPNIFMTHSANYNKLTPVHSNYPFPIYENSAVDQFIIQGEFTAENVTEARYWLAAIHFLRSVTKMAYGKSENQGSPPPVLKLNGYGDFVFKDLPVVVEQFQLNLPSDVDYIQVPDVGAGTGSWVPVRSEISVGVFPTFSRDSVNKFSLDKFVKGEYVTGTKPGGFI
jgi:hypothetical protein